MKKLFAITLCLVLLLLPIATIGTAAATDAGYTLEEGKKTYTVTTADGLMAVVELLNGGKLDYNVTLGANIDLAGKTWTPIGKVVANSSDATKVASYEAYKGIFDGAGYTISNLTADTSETKSVASALGLMATTSGATIKNLTLTGVDFKSYEYVGALVGTTTGSSITVENVHLRDAKIQGMRKNYSYAGGFFGKSDATVATVTDCTVVATIVGTGRVGGVFGGEGVGSAVEGRSITITNTIVAGSFTLKETTSGGIGGFLGYHSTIPVTLNNCVSVADMVVEKAGAVKGSVAMNANKITVVADKCVFGGHLFGKLANSDSGKATTTITSSFIYKLDETQKTLTIAEETAADAGVSIDGVASTWTDAKLPVLNSGEALRAKVIENFTGNKNVTLAVIEEILGHEHSYTVEAAESAYLKTAADCTNPAVYYKSCTCGNYSTDATFTHGTALGHTPSDKWSDGDEEHWHICGTCLTEKSDIAPHTYGDWTVTREPTAVREGERAKACTVCGHEVTEKIEKKAPETTPADTEEDTTSAATTDTNSGSTDKKEDGCGSILGAGAVSIVLIGAAICLKRKKND